MEEQQELKKTRFGLLEREVSTICLMTTGTELCAGTGCPVYQNCWRDLNLDKEGYFDCNPVKATQYSN